MRTLFGIRQRGSHKQYRHSDGWGTIIRKKSVTFLLLSMLAFLLAACAIVQDTPITPSIPPEYVASPIKPKSMSRTTGLAQPPSPIIIVPSVMREGMPTPRQAFEAMYGAKALSITDTEATLPAPVPNYTTTVHMNLMACFWEGLAEKCLVVTDSAFNFCHACQADIGGAVFQRIDGSWKLAVFRPTIISLGSFGYVPKGELIQIGPNKHAALIRSGWAGHGYEGEYATIIAEIDGSLRVLLNLRVSEMKETFAKDGTASLEWGYNSKMEFFAGRHSDIYDLVVTQYGINREGEKFKTVSLYTFSDANDEYVLVHQR